MRRVFAFAPPLPLLPPPSRPERRTDLVPGCGLVYSAAEDYINIQTVSLSPDFTTRHRHRRVVFQITAFNCTCLSDYLWESVGGAERVENVASLCKRKKTLSPSRRPLPRVTRRKTRTRTAFGFDFAPNGPVGGRGHVNSALPPTATAGVWRRPEVPAPPSLPAEAPTRCLQGGRTVTRSARVEDDGRGQAGKERTEFQEQVTRN